MEGNINIAYVGSFGFPYGFAENQHLKMVAKGLTKAGSIVTIICRKGIYDSSGKIKFPAAGSFEGINYIYSSGSIYRNKSFIKRNLFKIVGFINELKILSKLKRESETFAIIITSLHFSDVLYYWILSKFFKFLIVLNYVEFNSDMLGRTSLKVRINDSLFDHYSFHFADIILPISEFLTEQVKKRAPFKPYLKLTPLSDFKRFDISKKRVEIPYFVLCSTVNNYLDMIVFSCKAFELFVSNTESENVNLYLVVHGSRNNMNKLQEEISKLNYRNKIIIFSNISDYELNDIYINAIGLLIPLRPSLQDRARFPYKIAEYATTGNPIISTNYGEVKYYFKDGENAFIAEDYDPIKYARKMEIVFKNPDTAALVGLNAKSLALKIFNCDIFGSNLIKLILSTSHSNNK